MVRDFDEAFEDDEVEFEAPKKRTVVVEDDEDRPVAKKRSVAVDTDDDDDSEPVINGASALSKGWGAYDNVKSEDSPFATRLKVTDDPQIIKFLDDEPFAIWRQHWVERKGQKSFVCLSEIDERGCPLCDAGLRSSIRVAFNVVLLSPSEKPAIRSYEVGARVIDQLKNFHTDPRTGPLSKHFWAVSKSGKGATTATNHQLVKERDLEEWDIDALSESQLSAFMEKRYDASTVYITSRKDMLDIVKSELND